MLNLIMSKIKPTKILHFNVLFEQDEDGYFVATVSNIPGCYTQGKTLEEAKQRIKEAIKVCLKDEKSCKRLEKIQRPNFIGFENITVQYA